MFPGTRRFLSDLAQIATSLQEHSKPHRSSAEDQSMGPWLFPAGLRDTFVNQGWHRSMSCHPAWGVIRCQMVARSYGQSTDFVNIIKPSQRVYQPVSLTLSCREELQRVGIHACCSFSQMSYLESVSSDPQRSGRWQITPLPVRKNWRRLQRGRCQRCIQPMLSTQHFQTEHLVNTCASICTMQNG